MSRTALTTLSFLLLAACAPSPYASMCESVEGTDAQIECLEGAASQARSDVDVRLVDETDRVRDEATRRDLADRAADALREIDRAEDDTRDAVRGARSDDDRARDLRDGLDEIGRVVDRASDDLRDVADRADDEREGDEGDETDRSDESDRADEGDSDEGDDSDERDGA